MAFTWITKKQWRELERQQQEGDRLIVRCDWVKIARQAELRREGFLAKLHSIRSQQAPE